jgi:hypothetical protein
MRKKKRKSKKLPFVWWCPSDFYFSTRGMPRISRHAVRDLLDIQWDRGKVPDDEVEMARICELPLATFREHWKQHISKKFKPVKGGGFANKRMAKQRREAMSFKRERGTSGSKGGKESARRRALQKVDNVVTMLTEKKRVT